MTAVKATALKVTKVHDGIAAVDVLICLTDGMSGFKRLEVSTSRASNGGLYVEIEVPPHL
jgi:hypothetical protein